ncbi:MAG: serine/threonine protein kinase [Deltaproteobacteria bacterium]|nr:serine/threonine protein kinase [Deltaproteobacteria bacterium]
MSALPADVGFPRLFGAYLLLGPWSSGGMGEMYLARAGSLEGAFRHMLIKTLRSDLTRQTGYAERFVDEARVVMQLQHSGICQVFDAGRVDGVPYLAMELIRGVDLRRLVEELAKRGRSLPEGAALWLGCEIIEALDAAHRHRDPVTQKPLNVVHRDVSPHNVLVSFEGEVKLIDFGLAQSEVKETQTESHVVMGKVAYMAPEHARGDDTDARADQFAAAVLLFELLTGDRYYGDMSSFLIWQVVGLGGHAPRSWGKLDAEVANVLRPALAPKRDDRYRTCGELAARLRGLLAQRHPMMGRAFVRELMQGLFQSDLDDITSRVAVLGERANTAPMATAPMTTSRPTMPAPPSAAAPAVVEGTTGSTQTIPVARPAPSAGGRRTATLAIAIAGAALALGIGGVLVATRAPSPSRVAPPPASPSVTPPPPVPVVVPVPAPPAAPVPPPVEPVPVPLAVPPLAESPKPPATKPATTKPRPSKADRSFAAGLPRERKLELLRTSKSRDLCVAALLRMKEPPDELIDQCVDRVFAK